MKPKSKWVVVPSVRVFDDVRPDKAQALKPHEEVAEVFGAWQATHLPEDRRCERIVEECCDVIQATCNLLASIGVTDITEAMRACRERNRKRGRIAR